MPTRCAALLVVFSLTASGAGYLTTEIAREVAALGDYLRGPGDRMIVATARVHRLRLLTCD